MAGGTAHGQLVDLIEEVWNEAEVRAVARRMGLAGSLPGQGVSLHQLADEFVDLLRRRGQADRGFFARLGEAAAPACHAAVSAAAAAWGVPWSEPHRPADGSASVASDTAATPAGRALTAANRSRELELHQVAMEAESLLLSVSTDLAQGYPDWERFGTAKLTGERRTAVKALMNGRAAVLAALKGVEQGDPIAARAALEQARDLLGVRDELKSPAEAALQVPPTSHALEAVAPILAGSQSVFISYGRPNHYIAEALRTDLRDSGVKTWWFPEDARAGARIHREVRSSIGKFDRMVLLCSRDSLVRPGVINEIEECLQREAKEGGSDVVIPVVLDDVFEQLWWTWDGEGGTLPRAEQERREDLHDVLMQRVHVDLRETTTGGAKWQVAVRRVLAALRQTSVG